MKDSKSKRLCQNALNALTYAKNTDATISEGIGTFFKKHIIKIIMCVVVLALFLPGIIYGAILGGVMCGARDRDIGGTGAQGALVGGAMGVVMGAIASPFMVINTIKEKIFGSNDAINALSYSKIVDNSQTITKGIEQIPTSNRTYILGHYDNDGNFIKGYYK